MVEVPSSLSSMFLLGVRHDLVALSYLLAYFSACITRVKYNIMKILFCFASLLIFFPLNKPLYLWHASSMSSVCGAFCNAWCAFDL